MQLESLDDLLVAAGEAPPQSRIEYRDRIAAYGPEAIDRLAGAAWIGDPKYAAFAIRTIGKAGELGARGEAVDALRAALAGTISDAHRSDVLAVLAHLGARLPNRRPADPVRPPEAGAIALALEELVEGKCYTRTQLHESLGGNRRKGISYPANGYHCLLFSDPSKVSEYGYRDAPVGDDGYRYFGEWDGPGDMSLTGGNRMVLDRSPELYLFITANCGRVFLGRYACAGWVAERTTRDGQSRMAIVFELSRVLK